MQGVGRRFPRLAAPLPSVTLFVTTTENNRDACIVAISSALRMTRWPQLRLWVATDDQTDELEAALHSAHLPVAELRVMPRQRGQAEWYDWMLAEAQTDVWVAIHDDMIFTRRGWLEALVGYLTCHDIILVGGELAAPCEMIEPVGREWVRALEALSTWVFAVKSDLREFRPTPTFAFFRGDDPEPGDKRVVGDLGAQLITQVKPDGGFAVMPAWFTRYWIHTGHLSWLREIGGSRDKAWLHAQSRLQAHQRRHLVRLAGSVLSQCDI